MVNKSNAKRGVGTWWRRFVLKKGNQGLESKSNSTAVKKSLASKKGNQGLELRRNLGSGRRPLIRITLAQHHCPKHWHYYVITILHSHREMCCWCSVEENWMYFIWLEFLENNQKSFSVIFKLWRIFIWWEINFHNFPKFIYFYKTKTSNLKIH